MIPLWLPCTRTPLEHSGCLPPGRYMTHVSEIDNTLVSPFAAMSLTRASIFKEWRDRALEIDAVVDIYEEWVGGSLTTDKTDPSDLDVATIISATDFATLDKPARARLAKWSAKKVGNIHSFIFVEDVTTDPTHRLQSDFDRGYWDRLWSRHRNGGQKGYLMLFVGDI